MVGGLWFVIALGAAGLNGLRVETDTPDALCPPLEPVRDAVRSRLGEVEGGPYEARYAVVRGGNREPDVLLLTLTEGGGTELLRRELPLASLGCADAAEVIALVLERFFQQMSASGAQPGATAASPLPNEPPEPPEARAPDEATGGAGGSAPREPAPVGGADAPAEPPPAPGRSTEPPAGPDATSRWSLRGHGTLHSTGIPGAGLGAAFRAPDWAQVVLDVSWPLAPRRSREQEVDLASRSSWFFASGLLLQTHGPWSVGAGPLLVLQLEQAELERAPELSDGRKTRLLFGAGLHAVARLALGNPLELELGLRGASMLTGMARTFAVLDAADREVEVLRPAGLAWSVALGLNVRLGEGP